MNASSLTGRSRREEALTRTEKSETRHLVSYESLRQINLIAWKEFSDRFRSGWVIACVAVWLGAIGLTSLFGLVQIGQIGMQGYERTVISLLNLVQYLVPLLALLLGHDLVVSEREERTLPILIASGISRSRLLLGKFLGGCITLAVPLLLGFAIAGTAIGLAAKDNAIKPFLTLAISGLVLGIVFLAIGLLISTVARTRVQSLVVALLMWCGAVFVFDLVALGIVISTKSAAVAKEIEVVCDTTHVNAAADIHSSFDGPAEQKSKSVSEKPSLGWLAINPVDLFRAVNLQKQMNTSVPALVVFSSVAGWIAICLGAGFWKFRRIDL
jgi:Cu-processing system permease protein